MGLFRQPVRTEEEHGRRQAGSGAVRKGSCIVSGCLGFQGGRPELQASGAIADPYGSN